MILEILAVLVILSEIYFMKGIAGTRKRLLLRREWNRYAPPVSLIMPCRGVDHRFEDGVRALLSQDYAGRKEFIFVVDDMKDECVKILRKFKGIRILINRNFENYVGKNSALLTGVEASKGKALVFADSDILPAKDWLRSLVEPLQNRKIAVATGYRWYFPLRSGLVSCLRAAWDGIGFSLMTGKYRFVWGGSFAIRRSDFRKFGVRELWKNEISDDAPLTRYLDANKMRIEFAPRAVVASFDDYKMSEIVQWSNRQVLMVKMYAPKSWKLGMLVTGTFTFFTLLGIVLLASGNVTGGVFLLPAVLSTLRAWLRYSAMQKLLLVFAHLGMKRTTILMESIGKMLMFYNTLRVLKVKEVEWRGKKYRI
ncbi:MAG: glycosyltransferase family 2 protein [Candidatus Aenigmarchaeota archaeon]|nr:glycosyltransferase family 2 protein [Candidatus Aenigmarchaeota archaeon]